jgi:TP901 family phage tail tape measure protein
MRFSVEAVFSVANRFSQPLNRFGSEINKVSSALNKRLGQLDRFNDKLVGGFTRTAAGLAALAVPLGFLGGKVISTGAQFEQAITDVGAAWLLTRDQIEPLEKLAIDLGSTTKFTATEAANAMEIMAKSGFNMGEVMAGVGGILDAASASGEGIAETADHVSSIMKGMGLSAKDAFGPWASQTQRVADVLAAVSIETKSSIGSLGESMKNVAPVARQLGIPLEDVVMAVGLLQDVGLDASEAGTATATMLTKLAKPADEVAAKMRKMGIAFQDSHGNALPLRDILGQFAIAAKESGGNMDSLAFFADLVGLRGQKAALNLQEMLVSGKFDALAASMKNVHGRASEVANLKMNTTLGDWEKFTSALDGVQTKIFNLESGPLRNVIQRMTSWVEVNEDLIISKTGEWAEKLFNSLDKIANNLPTILYYAEMAGKGLIAWGAFTITAKTIGIAVGGVSTAIGGVNVALAAVAAFKAGGLVAALGTVTQAILGIEAAAGSAGAALGAAGLTTAGLGALAAGLGATALAVGGVGLAAWQNEELKKSTGGLSFLELVDESQRLSKLEDRPVTMAEASDRWRNEQARFEGGVRDMKQEHAASVSDQITSQYQPAFMTPHPEAMPQAEAQARLTERRTTNTQRSDVQLHLPKGVSASSRGKTPGLTIVPYTR